MKRWTAYKIRPEELVENEIVGNTLIIDGKRIHRVRILGEVKKVSETSILSFELEGGVVVKDFEKKGRDIKEKDLVDVIGRVGQFEGSPYVSLELYKIRNENREKWRELRDLEIEITRRYIEDEGEEPPEGYKEDTVDEEILEEVYKEDIDRKEVVLNIIKDRGTVEYGELLKVANIDEYELDKILEELLEEGHIYEPKAGIYKIIE
ncbi:MAG TPA: winged helix-turn-helix domain-containing protein [Methanothermococcus okinawensis]|uniref:Winged helix-turn-helix domain-containing protein n=1 Tax=Methanothermococcus okinawensis TaxID=155863 RepID=A0A832ZIL5_9EURY|nr:winged helix-turn-helix domain-containing protein [Methanothermococcus okinawensis]HIP90674.1 winged helix-turn-helix domain-containing protein [Methanothermococcus okinawensis]